MRIRHLLLVAFATAATLTAPGTAMALDYTVLMDGGHFDPPALEIHAGDTVTWTNRDALLHDASGDGWATELLNDDESDSVTFTATGSFDYICTIHPSMTGTIVVLAAGGGTAPTPPPGDAAPPVAAGHASALPVLLVVAVAGIAFGLGLRRAAVKR